MDRRSLIEFEQLEQELNNADSKNFGNMLAVKPLTNPPRRPYRSSVIGNVIHDATNPDDLQFKFGRMSSVDELDEFERLEQDLFNSDSENTDKVTPGSEDKAKTSLAKNAEPIKTQPGEKYASAEFSCKDIDPLGDFERIEEACQQLMIIKRRSEEQEDTLYQATETNKSQCFISDI